MYTANEEGTVEPAGNCICPSESYTCTADGVSGIELDNENLSDPFLHIAGFSTRHEVLKQGLRVLLSEVKADGSTLFNMTVQLFIRDLQAWNGSILICRTTGSDSHKDIHICVTGIVAYPCRLKNIVCIICTGPASPPTSLSVVWDPPSAVVSFQSPVYGGECVDYYVVTAVSGERNASCIVTSDASENNCSIYLGDGNVNDYNFTVRGVTRVNDSFVYNGDIATDCRKHLVKIC